jgi:hypothetical protein
MERISGPRDKHPSGKPLSKAKSVRYGDGYANRIGAKVARLQQDQSTLAIGFTARLTADEED